MKNVLLYLSAALIWGSTWMVITFQLGSVDPMVSVAYRFALSGILLLLYCKIAGLNMSFSRKDHLFIGLQGICLFALNYWLVYIAEQYITSGLVAIVFSTIVFLNIFNGAIFLGSPIRLRMILGAIIGFTGTGLVFSPELMTFNLSDKGIVSLFLALTSAFLASLGNITSARNQKQHLPVIQTNAFGMTYGAIIMILLSLLMGKPFNFEFTFAYIGSLFYLAILGSIVAFSCYLTLLGRIGADKAAYVTLVIPLIALVISTIYEDYTWSVSAFSGVVLIIFGNLLIIKKARDELILFYSL